MSPRNIFIILVILAVAFLGWKYWPGKDPQVLDTISDTNNDGVVDGKDQPSGNSNGNNSGPVTLNDSVRLSTPRSGDTVGNPLVVKGEARGTWFFEASFPVKLIGPDGKVLAQAPAQAKGEWMTTNFVPFEATLTYVSNTSGEGKLVLEKDNPSGLPQNADSVSIPVKIVKTDTMTTKVFFSPSNIGNDCSEVRAVSRTVPQTSAVAQTAIRELLKGPTSAEASAGVTSSIPAGVVLQKLEIKNGVAYADFSGNLDEGVGGSCRVTAIRAQIEQTLKQFSTVKSVVISINGRTEDILQP